MYSYVKVLLGLGHVKYLSQVTDWAILEPLCSGNHWAEDWLFKSVSTDYCVYLKPLLVFYILKCPLCKCLA